MQDNWSSRKILGDSLQVMASLAEREGLLRKRRTRKTLGDVQ
jgi:hypothetical protein